MFGEGEREEGKGGGEGAHGQRQTLRSRLVRSKMLQMRLCKFTLHGAKKTT